MTRLFAYEAFAADGKRIAGRIEAATRSEAHDRLRQRALIPATIAEAATAEKLPLWRREIILSRRIGTELRASFCRELGLLIKAGIPLDRALGLIAEKSGPGRLGRVIAALRERVVAGKTLSAALGQEQGFFQPDEIAMVAAGERSGDIATILGDLATALDRRDELAQRLASALVYPAILMIMAVVAVIVIMAVLVPNLMPLFENARTEPPAMVAALLGLSRFINAYWPLLIASGTGFGVGAWLALRRPPIRARVSGWLFRLPFFGSLAARSDSARFSRSLAVLLRSGAPMLQAIAAAAEACRNPAVRPMLAEAARRVASGQRLAAALVAFSPMPRATRQLIAIGEEANRLDDMLLHAANSDEAAVHRRIERAMTVLTPLLTLAIGTLIGGLIVSVMRAILSVNDLALQ